VRVPIPPIGIREAIADRLQAAAAGIVCRLAPAALVCGERQVKE
jgi:hypothetical protein